MKSYSQLAISTIASGFVLLFLLTGCGGSPSPAITLPSTVAPTDDTGSLSQDAEVTLRSLEKVNPYSFYVMHYKGAYEYPLISSTLPQGTQFSCSLFAALGTPGDMLFGRNFDWEFSPSLLLFTDPPDGYASVSMVDLTFLGIELSASTILADLPLSERVNLLAAPSMPFDGMNEFGLVIGMAALPEEFMDDASYDASRPSIGSIGVIRQALDHARDIEEALVIFDSYNIDFNGGPPIHYLLADPSGRAVLIEFYQSELVQLPNEAPFHMATNHLRYLAQGDGGCPRYHIIAERLAQGNGQLDLGGAMKLLSDVKQDITQWSTIYDMTTGDVHVAIDQKYDQAYTYHLDLVQP